MEKITLTLKDTKKKNFLLELLKQLDFVEIQKPQVRKPVKHDFFDSVGLWKNRDVNAEALRKKAWKSAKLI